jgi:hypothetical protein
MHSIEFPVHLGRLAGAWLQVSQYGSPIHRRAEVKNFVAKAGDAAHVRTMPANLPDMNPL